MAKLKAKASSNEELMNLLLEKYKEDLRPRAGLLERILAPISGIGSGIDAYYDARFQDQDASAFNVLKNYLTNVKQGFQTAATGKKYEDRLEGASELLDKTSPWYKQNVTNPRARGAVDVLSGILTDPTTYVGAGVVGLADDAIKAGTKAIAKNVGKDAAAKISREIAGETLEGATKKLSQTYGEEVANKFFDTVNTKFGKSANKQAVKVGGVKVTENPLAVGVVKYGLNPFAGVGAAAKTATKTLAPDLYRNLLDVFNQPRGLAEMGYTEMGTNLTDYLRRKGSINRLTTEKLASSGFLEEYAKLTPEQKEMFGRVVQSGEVPQGMEKAVSKYGEIQDAMNIQRTAAGLENLPGEQTYISQANPEGYKPEFITEYMSRDMDPMAIQKIVSSPKFQKEAAKGFIKKETLDELTRREGYDLAKMYGFGELGQDILGEGATKKRVFDTIEEAEAAGVVYGKDWLPNIYRQTRRQNEQLLGMEFAKNMVNTTDDAGNAIFVKSPTANLTSPVVIPQVGTFYTDPRVAKVASEYLGQIKSKSGLDNIFKGVNKMMNTWKGLVTAKGPNVITYHVRNALDDAVRMILGGHDITKFPVNNKIALELVNFGDDALKMGAEKAAQKYKGGAVAKYYQELGLNPDNAIIDLWEKTIKSGTFSDITQTGSEAMGDVPRFIEELTKTDQKLSTKINRAIDDIFTVNGNMPKREQIARLAHFVDSFRKTKSTSAAANAVKETLFNYSELSQVEKGVLKNIFPFYSFMKNNLAFYANLFANDPKKVSLYNNFLEGLESGTSSQYSEDYQNLPDYMKDTLTLVRGQTPEGELKTISNIGLGIEQINDLPINKEGLGDFAGNMNPLLKMLIEQATGKSFFYDKDILDINEADKYKNYPELLQQMLGYNESEVTPKGGEPYTKRTMAPGARYTLENTPFLSTLNRYLQRASNLSSGEKNDIIEELKKMFIPGTLSEQNPEKLKSAAEKTKYDDLYKRLRELGLADAFTKYFISDSIKEQLTK